MFCLYWAKKESCEDRATRYCRCFFRNMASKLSAYVAVVGLLTNRSPVMLFVLMFWHRGKESNLSLGVWSAQLYH